MGDNTGLWITLAIIGLLLGTSIGVGIATLAAPIREVTVEVPVDVPGETIYITGNVTEVEVADASQYLDQAIADLFDEEGDDDAFLTCGGHEFDEDEVSVSRVLEWSYTWLDDDESEVEFEAKFKFQDDSDERDCKETRTYTVEYEDGEDPIVS